MKNNIITNLKRHTHPDISSSRSNAISKAAIVKNELIMKKENSKEFVKMTKDAKN